MNVMGREIPDDDIRQIAGARCWVDKEGLIYQATKVREVTGKVVRWRAEKLKEAEPVVE